jgi:transcriptional regulator with XRE-family HTH domain
MSTTMSLDQAALLGVRLRRIRHQQGMSLADVQARSNGRWKAVVVGAYERGDRAITIGRLQELAEFYGVPIADLLPQPTSGDGPGGHADASGRYVLDLTTFEPKRLNGRPHLLPIARFAAQVRARRGDHNGRVLTVRASDLDALALTIGQDVEVLIKRLRADGALLEAA